MKAFAEKKLIVVTDAIKWPDNDVLVGISCFGFGGANGHVLVRKFPKNKINNGLPKDNLPRLVCISARTKETLFNIINDLKMRPLDAEYVGLYHNIFR